jgi:uncharacterized protein
MIIEVPKVSPDGSRYEGDEPASILELEGQKLIRADSSIHYDLFASKVSGELVVKGTLSVTLSVECIRCTEFFSTTLRDLSFLRAYEIPEGVETVDLTADIREDILLDLPAYPVCKPDCKGLCPQCGKNLNGGDCACRPPEGNDRWNALDRIKL